MKKNTSICQEILSPTQKNSSSQKYKPFLRNSSDQLKKANMKERTPSQNSNVDHNTKSKSYYQHYKSRLNTQNNSIQTSLDQQNHSTQKAQKQSQLTNLTCFNLKKRGKALVVQNPNQNEQNINKLMKNAQSQNQIKQRDQICIQIQSQQSSQTQINQEIFKDKPYITTNKSSKESVHGSFQLSKTPNNQTDQVLIYNKTLYKKDESFPTKDEISQKIANLVLKRFSLSQRQKCDQEEQPSTEKFIVQQKKSERAKTNKFMSQDLSQYNAASQNQFKGSLRQFTSQFKTEMSDDNIQLYKKNQEKPKTQFSMKDNPKSVSIYCSKLNSESKLLSNRGPITQEKLKTYNFNYEENLFKDKREEDLKMFSQQSNQSIDEIEKTKLSKNSEFHDSSASGSPKFNEMRKKKKEIKTSIDQNIFQSEQQFFFQIQQIEILQELIEPVSYHDIEQNQQYIDFDFMEQDFSDVQIPKQNQTNQNADFVAQNQKKNQQIISSSKSSPNIKKVKTQIQNHNQHIDANNLIDKNSKLQSKYEEKAKSSIDMKQYQLQNQAKMLNLKQRLEDEQNQKRPSISKKSIESYHNMKTQNSEFSSTFSIGETFKTSQSHRNQPTSTLYQQQQFQQPQVNQNKKIEQEIAKYLQSPISSKKAIYEKFQNSINKQKIQDQKIKMQNSVK